MMVASDTDPDLDYPECYGRLKFCIGVVQRKFECWKKIFVLTYDALLWFLYLTMVM